jgi:hypothetical protein
VETRGTDGSRMAATIVAVHDSPTPQADAKVGGARWHVMNWADHFQT